MPFRRRPNNSSGLDQNESIMRSHALEKRVLGSLFEGHPEKHYAGCFSHTWDGARNACSCDRELSLHSLSPSVCIAHRVQYP